MSDSELSEFEPYECFDDLAADLERYTKSQLHDAETEIWMAKNHFDLSREGGILGDADGKDPRGKIAIQIRPKRSSEGNSPIDKSDVRKMPFRAPSIEERMAKFAAYLPQETKKQMKTSSSKSQTMKSALMAQRLPLTKEDDIETIEINKIQRFRIASDTSKTNQNKEEISNNAARKSSFISDNLGLHVVGQSRSGVHKNRESSPNDHIKEEKRDANRENAKSSKHRLNMQPADGGEFPYRRKSSLRRQGLPPADEYQQQLSRFGTKERTEGGKQAHTWAEGDSDRSGHQKIGDQITDRAKNLSYYGYNKKADIRLSSSAKVAAVIKQGIHEQGPHSFTQQSTGANTQLPAEKVRSTKGGIYFPSQLQRSQSFGEDREAKTSSKLGFLSKDQKRNTSDATGKSPSQDQSERASVGIYSAQQKLRPQPIDDGRNPRSTNNTGFSSRKSEKNIGNLFKGENSNLDEQLRVDRSSNNLPRPSNPGVIYSPSKIHGSTFQNIENNSIKSQAFVSRARKNSSGFVEPRKIVSSTGSDRGKLVEKNNNTVWNTDSGSGSSEEERTIETDSSTTSSVIDERRRRRLVKRTRRRGLNSRKSQISQFLGREISAIESQTSDDGTSRASVDENVTDVLSPDEEIGKINSRESYKRAKQIFEKNRTGQEPQRIPQKSNFSVRTGDQQSSSKQNVKSYADLNDQESQFSPTENHTTMSTIHSNRTPFSTTSKEARNLHESLKNHRKHSGGTFSAVAKVSKITIPSLQLRNVGSPSRARYTSDTESYAGHSKILSDPFSLGRKSFRDNNLGFSDGEHELTARLERNEDLYEDQAFDDSSVAFDRRCYTLPRNIGRKKMRENPFQLNLPGKTARDPLEVQCNSQSSIEDVSVRSFPMAHKDFSPSRIQSRSAGNIGIDSVLSSGLGIENSLKTTENSTAIANSFTEVITSLAKQTENEIFVKEEMEVCSGESMFFPDNKADTTPANTSVGSTIPSPFYVELLAPPDNFKDSPDERTSEEPLVGRGNEKLDSPVSSKDDGTIASVLASSIAKETSKLLERTRGRPVATDDTVIEKSHERAGSPRRRPSYVKAQFSDSILWSESQNGLEKQDNQISAEDTPAVTSPEETQPPKLTNGEKETGDLKKKRARPRIPPTLGPVKPSFDDLVAIPIPDRDFPSPEKEEVDESKCDDNHNMRETSLIDEELTAAFVDKKLEKSEIAKRRLRPLLSATPMLEEIPEEKGHGSGSDSNIPRVSEEAALKGKRSRKQALSDLKSTESIEIPKDGNLVLRDTGYYSGSSIGEKLGSLDSGSESPGFNVLNFPGSETFDKNHVLKMFPEDSPSDVINSPNDPVSNVLVSDSAISPIPEQEIDPKWSSNSEPNLASTNLTPVQEPKRATSSQEVKAEAKEKTKIRNESTESDVRSPVDSPFEPATFLPQRTDSQKSFSSTSSVPQSPVSLPVSKAERKHDMRRHVLQNLLDTENSYVWNLNFLVSVYYEPLKELEGGPVIEAGQVDEIFFQIPEILSNHRVFLEQLENRANLWNDKQIVGDIFLSSFTKCYLMDAYSSFINNFLQARATVRLASTRLPFVKFVEQCLKEHKEKLTLQDLLIQPVQRIPRYVLILKDLIKHTNIEHPDFGYMQRALEEIKTLADRMNKGELEADQAEKEAEKLRDIEASIEGMSDLVTATRKFKRQDLVAEVKGVITKKDRCLFLFTDLLVCATVRRKNNALRRGSLGIFSGQSATEFNRYKFLWKLSLDATDLFKGETTPALKRAPFDKQAERLEKEFEIIGNIRSLADTLATPHQNLDICIRELITELNRQVAEQNQSAQPTQGSPARIGLQAQTEEGTEIFTFEFLSPVIKSSWEAAYEENKQKLAYARHTFPPEFQYPLPIDKTRSGMQFTCAAPSRMASIGEISLEPGSDIWVCNSDGYVGQVCLVSMVPEAQSQPSVNVCSKRIQCIAPVPGSKLISTNQPRSNDPRKDGNINETKENKKSSKSSKVSSPSHLKPKKSFPSESDEDDQTAGREAIIAFDSDYSDEEEAGHSPLIGRPTVFDGRMSPDGSSLGRDGSVEALDSDNNSYQSGYDSSDAEDPQQSESRRLGLPLDNAVHKGNHEFGVKDKMDDFLTGDNEEHRTMWLGTEEGCIHVYQSSDVTQVRKSKRKMQLGAVVNAILYHDNKVFVALANGELCVYKRDPGNGWEITSPQTIPVNQNGASITCIAAAAGRIWCGCQTNIILVNASTLKIESTIVVSQDSHRSVYRIVSAGLGVWISLQSSAVVRLYHATSFENLADIDVAPAVHKMLLGADAIIRQHKAACLRITALLACKDLLWIGTSAGVILTNPLPTIKVNTKSLRNAPGPTGSPHGHTGHVRFLTSVEVPKSQFKEKASLTPQIMTNRAASPSPTIPINVVDNVTRIDDVSKTITLVISGGDGYEDFRTSATSESVGRKDSTNHLLIWRV